MKKRKNLKRATSDKWNKVDNDLSGEFFTFTDDDDTIVGEWLGTSPGRGKFGGTNGKILTPEGDHLIFGISRALECLEEIEEGTDIKVVYLGKIQLDGGKSFKEFEVYTANKGKAAKDEEEEEEEEEVEEEEEEEEEEPAPRRKKVKKKVAVKKKTKKTSSRRAKVEPEEEEEDDDDVPF